MTQVTNFTLPGSPLPGASGLPLIVEMLQALRSQNSGPTAPANPVPGMPWRDTSTTPHTPRVRNSDNTAWIALTADLGFTVAGLVLATAADVSTQINALRVPRMVVRDEKSSGSDGGTFTGGNAWRTRDLNTVSVNTISGASVSANQVTLPAGTYHVWGAAPSYRVGKNRARLQRISGTASTLIEGTSAFSGDTANNAHGLSIMAGVFALTTAATIEVQHAGDTTYAGTGFGLGTVSGLGPSIFTQIEFERIGNA